MDLSKTLEEIVMESARDLAQLTSVEVKIKPAPNKWSKKEILGHLTDSAINNHRRFIIAPSQNDLVFDGYDQDEWVRSNNYQAKSWKGMIHFWSMYNIQLVDLIATIPDEVKLKQFDKHNFHLMGMLPYKAEQPGTLEHLIKDYVFHQEYHLAQILPDYVRRLGASAPADS